MKQITAVVLILIFNACTKNTDDPKLVADPDYCPLQMGAWIDYAVTSIRVDVNTDLYDTTQYTLREEVDALIDSSGTGMTYRIIRKIQMTNDPVWHDFDAILISKNLSSLVRQEHNTPLLSISYPLKSRKAWNGNVLNTLDSAKFYIKSLNVNDTSYVEFDSVLTIVQAELETLININIQTEKYTVGRGLIEQSRVYAYSPTPSVDIQGHAIPVLQRAETATIYLQRYLSHGQK